MFAARKIDGGDVEGWVARKQALTVSLLADSPRLYPGVSALVRAVRGRARLAVVTTTWRDNVATVLRASGLADAFDLIVAKEDVRAVKPAPECYRRALRRLRVPAGDAVALEDSPSGLAAARGAASAPWRSGTGSPPATGWAPPITCPTSATPRTSSRRWGSRRDRAFLTRVDGGPMTPIVAAASIRGTPGDRSDRC